MNWTNDAACRDYPPEWWFPHGTIGGRPADYTDARAVCLACPVIESCRDHIRTTREEYGMWAATTPEERAHYLPTNRPERSCGTRSGHQGHIRRGEASCDDCREASRAYDRMRDRARRMQGAA